MRRRFRSCTLAGLATVALALSIAGCGGATDSNPEVSSTTAAQGDAVTIKGFEFGPPSLTVAPGTKVTWTNEDSTNHTATANNGSFDTGTIKPSARLSATLTKPGTYTYTCQFHPFMKGTITVKG